MAPPKTDELPKAVDHDQIMNKVNLLFSQRSGRLGRRSKPDGNGADKPSPQPSRKKTQQQRETFSQPRDRDKGNERVPSENSGVGYVPEGKEAAGDARAAETRDLKGKLLGKRALEQREEARKKRARVKEDSSDEEEGRSTAVGKGRKKKGTRGSAD